jgi:hypothetical protein
MGARGSLVASFTPHQARDLFDWLAGQGETAFLTHAPDAKDDNYACVAEAVSLLKGGLDSRAVFSRYNKVLLSQRWRAYASLPMVGSGTYLLWHPPSGLLHLPTGDGLASKPIPDPYAGWEGTCSGSSQDVPLVEPATRLIAIDLRLAPDAVSTIAVPAPQWEATTPELKRFWRRLAHYVGDPSPPRKPPRPRRRPT